MPADAVSRLAPLWQRLLAYAVLVVICLLLVYYYTETFDWSIDHQQSEAELFEHEETNQLISKILFFCLVFYCFLYAKQMANLRWYYAVPVALLLLILGFTTHYQLYPWVVQHSGAESWHMGGHAWVSGPGFFWVSVLLASVSMIFWCELFFQLRLFWLRRKLS